MKIGLAMPASLVRLSSMLNESVPQIEEAPSFSDYILELMSRGHEVSLFTLSPHTDTTKVFQGDRLKVWLLPLRHRKRTGNLYATEIAAVKAAYKASGELDILHTHWLHEYTIAALGSGMPHLVTAHDAPIPIARYQRPLPYWVVRSLFASLALTRVRQLVVISPYLKKYYRKWHLFRGDMDIIPEFTSPDAYRHELRENNQATESRCQGMTFAAVLNGYNRRKNSDLLISAFAEYRRHDPKSKLLLFGHGHGPGQEAEQWARAQSSIEGVEFVGATRNDLLLTKIAQEVDIVVHPALEEAFGIAVADAMAMGKPVIGGKGCGAVPWVLDNGRAGILVNMRDVKSLVQAMVMLAKNPALREQLGTYAKKHARETFHISRIADRYCELYSKMVDFSKNPN